MPTPIRIAVIGAGAFGRNHLRVLHDLSQLPTPQLKTERTLLPPNEHPSNPTPPSEPARLPATVHLAAAVDPNPTHRAEAAHRYNIPTFATVDDLLAANLDLHAATVAVPTAAHAVVATQLLAANLDVLIEKPLTPTLAEADALITLAQSKNRVLAAGHLERFNPAVTAALARLTRPMFFEAHRLSVFTPRSLDVDVVLDLMIHDLDILLTMAQSPVTEVRAVGIPVLSRNVDIANVRLEFASGAIANLTASRISTEQVRKLRLFQPAQYLSLDYARQELLTIDVDPQLASLAATGATLAASPLAPFQSNQTPSQSAPSPQASSPTFHPSAGLNLEKLELPRAEPLRLELEDFFAAVQTRKQPRVTAAAARNALALALEINKAISTHAQQASLV